jgi:hypothetical protein
MTDDTNEEYLDNPVNNQSENSPDEIIPAKDTEIIKSKEETENMEVHHHPEVHHKKKKFKEYFLEFLMIFLAVTLGFFAENIREKIVSNERELNYMRSIVGDLKRDTAELSYVFFKQKFLINEIDSALNIPAETLRNIQVQDNFFRHYLYFYSLLSTFNPHDNTLTQLKNAGGFSVLHRSDVMDSIGELDLHYQNLIVSDNYWYNQFYGKVADVGSQVIKCPSFIISLDAPIFKAPKGVEVFTNYNMLLLQQLYSYINMEKGQILQCMDRELEYHGKAIRLINFINKKYNLD